jgi:LysM repeat protein
MRLSRRQFTKTALLSGVGGLLLAPRLLGEETSRKYLVKKGDTLGQIAGEFDVSTDELRKANQIPGDLIKTGQRLTIPESSDRAGVNPPEPVTTVRQHIVRAGDTLGAIAIRYGASVSEIKRYNGLTSDMIRVGQKLAIPVSGEPRLDLLTVPKKETAQINVRRSNWERIVVHHSGIKYGNAAKYDSAHRRRGMKNGLAYHFVIGNGIDSGDGEIEVGNRWKRQLLGGHVKSYRINLTAIGICLVGNFEQTYPSQRQLDAFTQLVEWLQGDVLGKRTKFAGHRELRGEHTICPGKFFPLADMHKRFGD